MQNTKNKSKLKAIYKHKENAKDIKFEIKIWQTKKMGIKRKGERILMMDNNDALETGLPTFKNIYNT